MSKTILRLDSSARTTGSVTRTLADNFLSQHADASIVTRDLNTVPHIDETWVGATFTPPEDRTTEQVTSLSFSDTLIEEVKSADHIVLTVSLYNFAAPSTLKAWLDHITRPGVSFSYGETGPQGLLQNKPVTVIVATGGTVIGSDADFVSGHLIYLLGFLGLKDVTIIAAEHGETAEAEAKLAELSL